MILVSGTQPFVFIFFFYFVCIVYTVKNEEFGLLFGGVIMGSNTYGESK